MVSALTGVEALMKRIIIMNLKIIEAFCALMLGLQVMFFSVSAVSNH